MEVLTGCGHSVHEDAPEKVYACVIFFIYFLKFNSLILQVAVIVANFLTRHTG